MLNPEIFFRRLAGIITHNFDPQQVIDEKRRLLLDQVTTIRDEIFPMINAKMVGVNGGIVDTMVTSFENACGLLLGIGLFTSSSNRSIAEQIIFYTNRRINATDALDRFGDMYPSDTAIKNLKKDFSTQIELLPVFRKIIYRETLSDNNVADVEYRENINNLLRLLRNIENVIRKLFEILFREYKDAIKAFHRKFEKVRVKKLQEDDAKVQQALLASFSSVFTMDLFDQWAKENPKKLLAILEKYSNK